mmetsp:Transcript_1280/g.3211  ORF Transcript_1280/g.3211 Transcript_1280/m.3211 type:complete len:205 (-) Transcript_1280:193-807(-)
MIVMIVLERGARWGRGRCEIPRVAVKIGRCGGRSHGRSNRMMHPLPPPIATTPPTTTIANLVVITVEALGELGQSVHGLIQHNAGEVGRHGSGRARRRPRGRHDFLVVREVEHFHGDEGCHAPRFARLFVVVVVVVAILDSIGGGGGSGGSRRGDAEKTLMLRLLLLLLLLLSLFPLGLGAGVRHGMEGVALPPPASAAAAEER